MPEYTLVCNKCNDLFERFSWGELDERISVCPLCGGNDVSLRWVTEHPFENIANFGCA